MVNNLNILPSEIFRDVPVVLLQGLKPPINKDIDQESAFLLAMCWKKKFDDHRELEIQEAEQDELGLRVIEDIRPPTLSHLFKT